MIDAATDFAAVEENLRFLILEVTRQVEDAMRVLDDPSQQLIEKIRQRDDYIDNMKSVIENKCFSKILELSAEGEKRKVDMMRSVIVITANLERIADYCENMVEQIRYMPDPKFLQRYNYKPFFRELLVAIETVFDAQKDGDSSLAMKICRAENNLDILYKEIFDRIMAELADSKDTGPLITALFIFRYLERAGDRLLNIGEAIIFSIMGEKFKIHEYRVLEETLGELDVASISEVELEAIWGTRSGCRISRVNGINSHNGQPTGVIFKHGKIKKLAREIENIERWETLVPGLPPKICGRQNSADEGAILLEYLNGRTLQDIILNGDRGLINDAINALRETVQGVWRKTFKPVPVNAGFVAQMKSRIDDVYKLHPHFRGEVKNIGPVAVPSLDDLLEKIKSVSDDLTAPFSVFIHGDFNINNIIYDPACARVHFIDLYRSGEQDYIQDVSVFLVSNFRLPVFNFETRENLNSVSANFFEFASGFARANGDNTFNARLALSLARSFITSTRFEYRDDFARTMLFRGVYLIEKLLAHSGAPWEEFGLPVNIVVY